jgi:DNA-binding MarR family transcriptional regulator
MKNEDLEKYVEHLQDVFMATIRRMGKEMMESEPKVTGPQFFILQFLHKKGKSTVSGLAEEMSVKPSAITAMIDRLHKQGFVLRDRDEHDRRVVFIQISDVGQLAMEETVEKRKKILLKYLAHLEPEEVKSLIAIYEKLARIDIKG